MGGCLPWLAPPRWLAPLLVARGVDAASLVWDGMERDDPTFDAQTSELVYGDTSEGYLNVSKVGDAVSGAASLRVDYEVVQAEGWGGFAQYSRVFGGAMLDCSGATEISFWYNNVAAQSAATRAHLRLIVHECEGENGCLVENAGGAWASSDDVENHYAFFGVLDDAPGWRRAAVAVDELVFTGWSGTADGDQAFDPGAIVEYTFQFSVDAEGAILSSTAGAILLDRLACDGPDDLVFAPLDAADPFRGIFKPLDDPAYESNLMDLSRNPFLRQPSNLEHLSDLRGMEHLGSWEVSDGIHNDDSVLVPGTSLPPSMMSADRIYRPKPRKEPIRL